MTAIPFAFNFFEVSIVYNSNGLNFEPLPLLKKLWGRTNRGFGKWELSQCFRLATNLLNVAAIAR